MSRAAGGIRVGVGGWTFAPWRGTFYPNDVTQKNELAYASRKLTAIEINATFYGAQKPESFRRWAAETPDGFVFSLKGPRYATSRRVLAEGKESVERFVDGGLLELGDKLGPLLWQLPATKKFDPDDIAAFLALLPRERGGRRLRHVIEAGHESFADPAFVALLREAGVAQVMLDDPHHPMIADVTADFVYLRLERSQEDIETGYSATDLDVWARRLEAFAAGGQPEGLSTVGDVAASPKGPRDVFAYVISGAKIRNPAAARALIDRLSG